MTLVQQIARTHAEVARGVPGAQKRLEALQARYRGTGAITRVGGLAELVYEPATSRPRRSTVQRSRTTTTPAEFAHPDVELREYNVDFKVRLWPALKEEIKREIDRAHREAGREIEVGGWLFSQYVPRADTNRCEVAFATRSTERPGTSYEVFLDDPAAAEVAVHGMGLAHLKVVGDWHAHTARGSELPSLQDARAWCGTMTTLGREAYVSVIVSPSKEQGWMFPEFSAWVAGTYGSPSTPVVGRASLA